MQLDLRDRAKKFALRIIKLYSALPRRKDAQVLGTKSSSRELRLARITGKPAVLNLMPISSAR